MGGDPSIVTPGMVGDVACAKVVDGDDATKLRLTKLLDSQQQSEVVTPIRHLTSSTVVACQVEVDEWIADHPGMSILGTKNDLGWRAVGPRIHYDCALTCHGSVEHMD